MADFIWSQLGNTIQNFWLWKLPFELLSAESTGVDELSPLRNPHNLRVGHASRTLAGCVRIIDRLAGSSSLCPLHRNGSQVEHRGDLVAKPGQDTASNKKSPPLNTDPLRNTYDRMSRTLC